MIPSLSSIRRGPINAGALCLLFLVLPIARGAPVIDGPSRPPIHPIVWETNLAKMFISLTAGTNSWQRGLRAGTNITSLFIVDSTKSKSATYVPAIRGTNITRISVSFTQGTNHVFYYPGRLRWKVDQALRKLGLHPGRPSQMVSSLSARPQTQMWIQCEHTGQPPFLRDLSLQQMNSRGARQSYWLSSWGGVQDTNRNITVVHFPLFGGITNYAGSTIFLQDKSNRTEIAILHIQ